MLESENFYLYYQQVREPYLQEVARMAEAVHTRLTNVFPKKSPYKTHVVITDQLDTSDGFAYPTPYPHIELYLSPPTDRTHFGLGQMEWLEYLFTHEYAHILQLGAADGVAASLRHVFGSMILPAAFVPPWAYEGWAVFCESNFGPATGGRLSAPSFRALLSADDEEGKLKRLDQVSNMILDWTAYRYWHHYGGLFHEYLGEKYGEERIIAFYQELAGELPFIGFESTFRRIFGLNLKQAYADWQAQLPAQVGVRTPTPGRALTASGATTGLPHWDSAGNLYYIEENPRSPSRLMKGKNGKFVPVANWDNAGEYVLAPDGDLIFTQIKWENDYYYSDLYRATGEKRKTKRLTKGMRASQPSVSPDGLWLIFTINDPPVRHLYRMNLKSGEVTPFLLADGECFFSDASWSPDGQTIAVVVEHKGLGRRIELVEAATKLRSPLTGWWWEEGEPAWDPSGRYLIFTAQQHGQENLYAYDRETQTVRLLVHNAGRGVVSPDGKDLAFVGLSATGWNIYLTAFNPEEGEMVVPPAPRVSQPVSILPEVTVKASAYRAWPSWRPHFWLPMIRMEDNGRTSYGMISYGQDVLGFYGYDLYIGLGSGGRLSYDLNLTHSAWGPELKLNLNSNTKYGVEISKTWRSVAVPNDTFRLGAAWKKIGGWQGSLLYSTARTYGLNPAPSKGQTLVLQLVQLEDNEAISARINQYAPLGRGIFTGNLQGTLTTRKEASFGLPGYKEQPVGRWRAGAGLKVQAPLVEFQSGLFTPPVYLLDSWGGLGINLYQVDGEKQIRPALEAELKFRAMLGFISTPFNFNLRFVKGLHQGRLETSFNTEFAW